ncbi:MAG TPA: hypothetical protein VF526_11615 [Solirubrobacteraceae bacterium]
MIGWTTLEPRSPHPEVEMTKYRAYPFLITAISLLAAAGGGFRIT